MILEGGLGASKRELVLGGLLLGLAGWTRVEGPIYAIFILAAGMIALAISGRTKVPWGWTLAPMALLWAPWFVFYRTYGGGGSQAVGSLTAALEAFRSGVFHLGALRVILDWMIRSAINLRVWGYVWILAAIVTVIGFRRASATGKTAVWTTAAMGGGAILATVLIFYIGSFGISDVRGWLDLVFERFFLPVPALFFVSILWLLVPSPADALVRGKVVGPSRREPEPGPSP
jgi:hypothetical protein